MAVKTVFITSGTTFTVPADFLSLVSVEAIGGGGAGGGGGTTGSAATFTGVGAQGIVVFTYNAFGVAIGAGWSMGAGFATF